MGIVVNIKNSGRASKYHFHGCLLRGQEKNLFGHYQKKGLMLRCDDASAVSGIETCWRYVEIRRERT